MLARWIRTIPLMATALATASACGQSLSDPGLGLGGQILVTRSIDATEAYPTAALTARFRLTGGIAVEGFLSYRQAVFASGGKDALRLTEVPLQVSLLLFPAHWSRVQPYLALGAGYYFLSSRSLLAEGEVTRSGGFGLHVGCGLEARASRRVSVFVDARWVYRDLDEVSALSSLDGRDRRAHYGQLGVGALLLF